MDIPDNRNKTGIWIKNRFHDNAYTCSECDIQTHCQYWYCPGCGAKMDLKTIKPSKTTEQKVQ